MEEKRLLRKPDTLFCIWSYEHEKWWKQGAQGYTPDYRKAGIYSKEAADNIVEKALGNEVAIPVEAVRQAFSVMFLSLVNIPYG